MTHPDLHTETRDHVFWITLDRAASRNGLTIETVQVMEEHLQSARDDDEIRAVVISGANETFCSGLDLKFAMASFQMAGNNPAQSLSHFQKLARTLYTLPKPTIASIDGTAAGFGGDIALACDMRIMTQRARIGSRFTRIGLMPDGGSTFFLPRLIGTAKTYELIYSGSMLDADTCLNLGLVNRVVPNEDLRTETDTFVSTFAQGPPLAYAAIKRAIQASAGDLDTALQAEGEGQVSLLSSQDFFEGVQAFLQRRDPSFKGK